MDFYDCIRDKGNDIAAEFGWARMLLYYQLKKHPDRMYATVEDIQEHYRKLGRPVPSSDEVRNLLKGFESTIGDGFEMDGKTFQLYEQAYSGCIPKKFFDHFANVEARLRRSKPTVALVVFWLGPIGAIVGIAGLLFCGKG